MLNMLLVVKYYMKLEFIFIHKLKIYDIFN